LVRETAAKTLGILVADGVGTERMTRSRREVTMNPRKLLAVAVLAALPTVGAVARPTDPVPQTQASWIYAFDMDRESALAVGVAGAIGCSMFLVAGAIACGLVGAA
jgi:hypothetical protein